MTGSLVHTRSSGSRLRAGVQRVSGGIVGVVWVTAGVSKALDPRGFLAVVDAHGVLPVVPFWMSFAIAFVECSLGVAVVAVCSTTSRRRLQCLLISGLTVLLLDLFHLPCLRATRSTRGSRVRVSWATGRSRALVLAPAQVLTVGDERRAFLAAYRDVPAVRCAQDMRRPRRSASRHRVFRPHHPPRHSAASGCRAAVRCSVRSATARPPR